MINPMGSNYASRVCPFPMRVRGVLVATGVVSALTFFPSAIIFLEPLLLVASGIVQPRFPRPGRWLAWLGAAGISIILAQEDILLFRRPLSFNEYARLPSPFASLLLATTVLAVWSDVELIADGLRSMHAPRSGAPEEPQPVGRGMWILAVLINIWVGWGVVLAPGAYQRPGGLAVVLQDFIWMLLVIIFDIKLAKRYFKARRTGGPGL